jgi:hypothetical protein
MKLLFVLFSLFFIAVSTTTVFDNESNNKCISLNESNNKCISLNESNNKCISFTIGQGTGCEWMCNYCDEMLGTSNYYFQDGVCHYKEGSGCVGNPISGHKYTCCAV